MTGYGNISKTKQDGSRVQYVFSLMPEKKIKLCSASRMTFRAWFYRTDPQNIGGQFGTLSGFLRNTFRKGKRQKKPRNIFQSEKFQDYF